MDKILIRDSALKHGITEIEILAVLADQSLTKPFEMHEDKWGNPPEMLVGFTQASVLLEIAVRYTEDWDEIFHTNRVSAAYRMLYEGA